MLNLAKLSFFRHPVSPFQNKTLKIEEGRKEKLYISGSRLAQSVGARSGFFKNKKLPEFPCYQNNTNSKSEICSQMRIIAPSYISSFQCKWEDFILHKSLFGRRSNTVWRIFSVMGGVLPKSTKNIFIKGGHPEFRQKTGIFGLKQFQIYI